MRRAEVAADFDVSIESVRRWVRQADADAGVIEGQTAAPNKLVQLRRDKDRLEVDNETLHRAAAYRAAGIRGRRRAASALCRGERTGAVALPSRLLLPAWLAPYAALCQPCHQGMILP